MCPLHWTLSKTSHTTALPTSHINFFSHRCLLYFLNYSCVRETFSCFFLFCLKIKSLTCRWWSRRWRDRPRCCQMTCCPCDVTGCHSIDKTTARTRLATRILFHPAPLRCGQTSLFLLGSLIWQYELKRLWVCVRYVCVTRTTANWEWVRMTLSGCWEAFKRCRHPNVAKK